MRFIDRHDPGGRPHPFLDPIHRRERRAMRPECWEGREAGCRNAEHTGGPHLVDSPGSPSHRPPPGRPVLLVPEEPEPGIRPTLRLRSVPHLLASWLPPDGTEERPRAVPAREGTPGCPRGVARVIPGAKPRVDHPGRRECYHGILPPGSGAPSPAVMDRAIGSRGRFRARAEDSGGVASRPRTDKRGELDAPASSGVDIECRTGRGFLR